MKQWVWRGLWWGGLLSLVVAVAWAQTTRSPSTAKSKLERLRIAVTPLGWDTNFTWLQTRSGMLDKRPALEWLCRKFCSGGHEGAVGPVCVRIKQPGSRTVRPQ